MSLFVMTIQKLRHCEDLAMELNECVRGNLLI